MALFFEVHEGTSACLAIMDKNTGLRVCGEKQWGGSRTTHKWEITETVAKDILGCLREEFPSLFAQSILADRPPLPSSGLSLEIRREGRDEV